MNPVTDDSRPKLARGVRLRDDPLDGEPLLLYPEGFLPLDSSARDILIRCDGGKTIGSIIQELGAEYEADPAELRADILEYVTRMRHEMLLALS